MTPPPATRPSATEQQLLETAIALIWASSYHRVGVNEICQHAGVTKGAFYHHFASKADLFCAASRHYWEQLRHQLDEIFSPTRHPADQLEALFIFALGKQHRGPIGAQEVTGCPFFSAGALATEEEHVVRSAVQDMSSRCHQYNRALVQNLQLADCLEAPLDADQTARLMQHYVKGLMMYGRLHNSLESVERDIREGVYRLLGLKPEYRRSHGTITASSHATPSQ